MAQQSPGSTLPAGTAGPPPAKPGFSLQSRSGSAVGTLLKLALLAVGAAIAVYAALPLISDKNWLGLGVVIVATAILSYIYLTPRFIPAKYLAIGTVLLIGFQIVPVIYTITTAFTNFGDGHRGSKDDAIVAIQSASVKPSESGAAYKLSIGVEGDLTTGTVVFLLVDADGNPLLGTPDGLTPLDKGSVTQNDSGKITAADGYTVLNLGQAGDRQTDIEALKIPTDNGAILAKGVSQAFEGGPTRSYEAGCDCITDAESGQIWTANDDTGFFQASDGSTLAQGWRINVGFGNFGKVFANSTIASAFLGVVIWNFVFAIGTVLLSFAFGLAIAMVMNSERLKGKKVYRSILILPYAMPVFAMLLLWRDMFNTDYGLFNRLFGLDVDWLGNPWAARIAVLIVQIWVGYPYMFLVCTGALQAIPSDLIEAAGVDGAKPFHAFRTITLPLLLVAVGPLLIASFAFNFNNFGGIFLVTGGGPFPADNPTVGATDLLITYTYRLAFGASGAQYGYAAAISMLIFIIVAAVSYIGFRRTKALEEVN